MSGRGDGSGYLLVLAAVLGVVAIVMLLRGCYA